jgi:hypothetical protein
VRSEVLYTSDAEDSSLLGCVTGQVGPDNMAPHPGRLESSVLSLLLLLLLHRQHENYKFSKYLNHTVIKQIGSLHYFVKKRIVSVNK